MYCFVKQMGKKEFNYFLLTQKIYFSVGNIANG